MQFEVSEQEWQIIESLHQRQRIGDDDFCLEIRFTLGAWEVKLSMPEEGKWARGVGPTLDAAWDNVAPSWA